MRTPLLALLTAGVLLTAACTDDGDDSGAARLDSEEGSSLIDSAVLSEGPVSVLSAELAVETTDAATLEVELLGPDGARTAIPTGTEPDSSQTVPVVGLRAEQAYTVAVTATDGDGAEESVELDLETPSLPDDLPDLDVTVAEPAAMSPGVTLFNARYWGEVGTDETPDLPDGLGFILGLDAEGEVVWYYRTTLEVTDVSVTPRGTLLVSIHDVIIREIDMLGRTLNEWGTAVAGEVEFDFAGNRYLEDDDTPVLDIDSAHHELYERDNGNIITISTEVIDLDPDDATGLCAGEVDEDDNPVPDPAAVVGDVVVELSPEGDVVNEWKMSDYFDPIERPGADMCRIPNPIAPPNWFYPDREDLRDWTHANAAVVDEATNTLMVSMRHLDALIGIRYADDESGPAGELLWDLSPDGDLAVAPGGDYSLHGHAVEPQPDGTVLYYDNGNFHAGTESVGGSLPNYSRAVQYRIDPATKTATQLWEHRDTTPEGVPVFAGFLGDADRLANGNVLITHGGMRTEDDAFHSRITEVVPGDDGVSSNRVVFDLTLGDRATVGWTAYRAERLVSLLPAELSAPAGV